MAMRALAATAVRVAVAVRVDLAPGAQVGRVERHGQRVPAVRAEPDVLAAPVVRVARVGVPVVRVVVRVVHRAAATVVHAAAAKPELQIGRAGTYPLGADRGSRHRSRSCHCLTVADQ
jgi:hypothetical protein